jgi:hypothetical protein
MEKIYFISRYSLVAIFFYHGLVPKLLFKNHQEVLMNNTMMPFVAENTALLVSGWMEIFLAILLLIFFKNLLLNYIAMTFVFLVSIAILIFLPILYTNAFNPFSLNLAVIALAMINISSHEDAK